MARVEGHRYQVFQCRRPRSPSLAIRKDLRGVPPKLRHDLLARVLNVQVEVKVVPKLEVYRAKLLNPPSLVGRLRTRPLDRLALSVCLAFLAGSASADTFSFDGDGGSCDWAEGQSNKYVEIGYEGSLFVDVTRGMAINAGILKETKLNNGLYQYYVDEDGVGEFWVTFDPKSGKLVEGKISDRAEMSAVDWTVAANVTDLKPCEKRGSGPEECDDCD